MGVETRKAGLQTTSARNGDGLDGGGTLQRREKSPTTLRLLVLEIRWIG